MVIEYILSILAGAWSVTAEMAPYLLFGFAVAGVLSVLISPAWVERHLGGRGLLPVVKAVLLGVPLPLCSCGVIPVTASIRNHGASRGATLGFLIATPETGMDSIIATWGMLGPVFGILRPLVAFTTGIIGGALASIGDIASPRRDLTPEAVAAASGGTSCGEDDACCSAPVQAKQGNPVVRAAHYGFVILPRDIGKHLAIGIAVAGLIGALVPEDALAQYLGGGILAVVALMLLGIPVYVCATASIPIALGFIHMGVSPGAALAFLISGPATNAATIAMVWRVLGRRMALLYLGVIATSALLSGLGLDAIRGVFGSDIAGLEHAVTAHIHDMGLAWWQHALGVALVLMIVCALLPTRRRKEPSMATENATNDSVTLEVTGMTCSHCSGAVERGLRAVPGVEAAEVDLQRGRAVVRGLRLDTGVLVTAVQSLGYEAKVAG